MMKIGAFAAAVAALASTALAAETPNRPQLAAAVKAAHADNLKRLQDWIAHPTIAAEKTNVDGGAEYMRRLLLEAGFQQAKIVPTDAVSVVFATLDSGAPTTLGIYFMYDVKQCGPSYLSSLMVVGRVFDRPEGKA